MMLTIPPFDKAIFKPTNSTVVSAPHAHVMNEFYKFLNYMCDYQNEYPVCRPIMSLLEDTLSFLGATATDPLFFETRKNRITSEDAQKILNDMASSLEKAQTLLLSCQGDEKTLLKEAIDYCKEGIKLRVAELEQFKDFIYVNHWRESRLANLLNEEA